MKANADDLRRKGYCEAAIEACVTQEDSKARIRWMEGHIVGVMGLPGCETCYFAMLTNNIELACAQAVGPSAVAKWQRGEFQNFPKPIIDREIGKAMAERSEDVCKRYRAWLVGTVRAHWSN